MMYGYNGGYYPFHMFGDIFMFIFWIIIIAILFRFLVRGGRGYRHWGGHWRDWGHPGADPVNILKERYAKGEITKEQFESMKKDIE